VEKGFMIECTRCNEHFHGKCVGFTKNSSQGIEFHCSDCLKEKKNEKETIEKEKLNSKTQETIVKSRSKKREVKKKEKEEKVNLNVINFKIEISKDKEHNEWCICRKAGTNSMIQCDECSNWYHFTCVGVNSKEVKKMKEYKCSSCLNQKISNVSSKVKV
jgi:hypothetical protein